MQGTVFSIEEFSVYDGPGIRTTVFLKGCPLRCSWCHNPEGQRAETEIIRSPNGCIGCNACIENAEKKNGEILFTERSVNNCPMNLLRYCGEKVRSDELCNRILKNERILNSGGGVTFSGGEPLMQSEFVFDCLKKLCGKIHTAIQTSGFCSRDVFEKALELADCFLYDLKIIDDDVHRKYTGVSNAQIIRNYSTLANSGKEFVTRIPLIPSVTDTEENIRCIARMLNDNCVSYAELLPYNKMAGGKYKMLQKEYLPMFDESVAVSYRREIFDEFNIETKIL